MSHSAPICLSHLFFSAHAANPLRTLRLGDFNRKGRNGRARSSQRKSYKTRFGTFFLFAIWIAVSILPARAQAGSSSLPIQYAIALTNLSAHKVRVTVT